MHLSFSQTNEPFIFLSLKYLNFGAEIYFEFEDVFKFKFDLRRLQLAG